MTVIRSDADQNVSRALGACAYAATEPVIEISNRTGETRNISVSSLHRSILDQVKVIQDCGPADRTQRKPIQGERASDGSPRPMDTAK